MTLPYREIASDLTNANVRITNIVDDYGSGGSYLSEFLSLQGLIYKAKNANPTSADWCAVAGHIHVGIQLPVAVGTQAVEVQLRRVIAHVDRLVRGDCQVSLGGGGLGRGVLSMCGSPLRTGGRSELLLRGAPANSTSLMLLSGASKQQAVSRRIFWPASAAVVPLPVDARGEIRIPGILGGGGPFSIYAQVAWPDFRAPSGFSASNALQIRYLR